MKPPEAFRCTLADIRRLHLETARDVLLGLALGGAGWLLVCLLLPAAA